MRFKNPCQPHSASMPPSGCFLITSLSLLDSCHLSALNKARCCTRKIQSGSFYSLLSIRLKQTARSLLPFDADQHALASRKTFEAMTHVRGFIFFGLLALIAGAPPCLLYLKIHMRLSCNCKLVEERTGLRKNGLNFVCPGRTCRNVDGRPVHILPFIRWTGHT